MLTQIGMESEVPQFVGPCVTLTCMRKLSRDLDDVKLAIQESRCLKTRIRDERVLWSVFGNVEHPQAVDVCRDNV